MKILIVCFITCLLLNVYGCNKQTSANNNLSPMNEKVDSFVKTAPVTTQELLIQLKKNTDISLIEEAFKGYELKSIKLISKHLNIWLVSYNAQHITAQELLLQIKSNSLVKDAQTNKKMELRND